VRSEDRNARQVQQGFATGATLAELERHIAYLRSLIDARPGRRSSQGGRQ